MSVTRATTGMLSKSASPMPVRALVNPGPGTTEKTPTVPVARAAASAMTLAEASCVTSRYGTDLAFRASQNSLFWAPGMPKTQRTPWQARAAAAACAPVIFPWTPARLVKRPSSTWPARASGARADMATAAPERCLRKATPAGLPWVTPSGSLPARAIRAMIRPRGRSAGSTNADSGEPTCSYRHGRRGSIARGGLDASNNPSGPGITLQSIQTAGAISAESRQALQNAGPVARRVFAEVLDAFEDDRAGVADGIERTPPRGPVDRSVAGGQMRILAAVIVVDVGRRQERARPLVFRSQPLRPDWRGRYREPGARWG